MGRKLNICALLAGLAAFAGWTLFRSTAPRRMGWVHLLGGIGILALFFSMVSPDDDAFQQELIRPTPPSATVAPHTKMARGGSLVDLWIHGFAAAGDPNLALKTGHLLVMDEPFDRLTRFEAPISIHSPPITS